MKLEEKIKELENRKNTMIKLALDSNDFTISNVTDYVDLLRLINFTLAQLKEIDPQHENVFDVDNMISGTSGTNWTPNNKTDGETIHSIQLAISNRINAIKTETTSTKLITNGNIASVLQDITGYSLNPSSIKIDKTTIPFPIGKLWDIDMFVDAKMRWDDNRIIFFKEDKEVYTLKIRDSNNVLL